MREIQINFLVDRTVQKPENSELLCLHSGTLDIEEVR
jgi:hypothetical protein